VPCISITRTNYSDHSSNYHLQWPTATDHKKRYHGA
jgi:hypothetical protein